MPLPFDLVHRDRAADVHALRWSTQPSELATERRDEAGRVRRREQLLGARLPLVDLDPRRRSSTGSSNAPGARGASRRPTRARSSPPSRSPPRGRCAASYAITSTRDSSSPLLRRLAASLSSTRWSAWIETSTWSSRRLARRQPLQPEAGREQRHQHAVVLVLARVADQLVGEPGDDRQEQDPARDQPVPDRPADEREDEDRDHHHPEQKRCSATRVDQAELLHIRGRELGARLERVDRLVLGAVVLEDAPQVGEQRDQRM